MSGRPRRDPRAGRRPSLADLPRRAFSWKFLFYDLLLPALVRLGPSRADAALGGLGRLHGRLWPGERARLVHALGRACEALELDEAPEALVPSLAAARPRFLARDYSLDAESDASFHRRFEVHGREDLARAIADGRGAVLVGSHFGAHLAGLHWLFRSGLPVRAMVQRPCHLSRTLARLFDEAGGPHPQADLFLRRALSTGDAVELVARARAALRDGLALYACGDVPWPGANARPGRLLGRPHRFLAVWAELAALARAPVFHVFCAHLPGGRFRLEIEAVGRVHRGEEDDAVADYLKQLEARIATAPAEAVAHLLWPCFQAPAPSGPHADAARPSRRRALNARRAGDPPSP